ncbi:MAG: glycosyltransferase [Xenococcaceae cyanobacterium MO_207.B15]|nr:glycosyltransferase [Xenococcaceae cyanobacterium MO_207.B15]
MKIAVIVNRFPVLSETFIMNQILGAMERGHEVHIYPLTLHNPSGNLSQMSQVLEKYNLFNSIYYPPTIPQNYLLRLLKGFGLLLANLHRGSMACLSLLNFFKYGQPAYSLWLFYQGISVSGGSYDVIHSQFGFLGSKALLFRNLGILQGKLITSFRGYDISQYVEEQGNRVYEQLFAEGDFFFANCEFFRQQAIKLGCAQEKIVVHGSGIDCHKFAFTPRHFPADGKIRLATTGRLIEKKGIEYSIRAIAKVVQKYPEIEYNIIGDGALRESFEQLISELNLGHIIKLLGAKQQQKIIKILHQSHIFIAPSVTAANGDRDAPINTLKEAMAMGLPVISTHHGGIPELVEDGVSGFLVAERDSNAIADKISYLIEHPECWGEMGQAGRSCVEAKYDMNKLNDELVKVYEQLMNSEIP